MKRTLQTIATSIACVFAWHNPIAGALIGGLGGYLWFGYLFGKAVNELDESCPLPMILWVFVWPIGACACPDGEVTRDAFKEVLGGSVAFRSPIVFTPNEEAK